MLSTDESIIKEVIIVAKTQVGLRELTDRNDGPHIEIYLKSVGLKGNYPYCAAGVYWCFERAVHNLEQTKTAIPIKRTASANAIFDDAKIRGVNASYLPRRGELLVWKIANSYSGHIEIIIKPIKNGLYQTIGFNTGTGDPREGQGNYYRIRSIFDPIGRLNVRGIVGFIYNKT